MALGNFPNVQNYLKQWTEIIIAELRKSAIDEMNENKSKSKYKSYGSPERSTLVAGMHPVFNEIFGSHIEAQIIMPASWKWLEGGRGPGKMPPEEPIVKWIVQRGIPVEITEGAKKKIKKVSKRLFITKGEAAKERKSLKKYSRDQKRKQLAFLIRRKIGKDGTRATHFYSNIVTSERLNNLKQVLKEKFNKEITITMIEEIKKEI